MNPGNPSARSPCVYSDCGVDRPCSYPALSPRDLLQREDPYQAWQTALLRHGRRELTMAKARTPATYVKCMVSIFDPPRSLSLFPAHPLPFSFDFCSVAPALKPREAVGVLDCLNSPFVAKLLGEHYDRRLQRVTGPIAHSMDRTMVVFRAGFLRR